MCGCPVYVGRTFLGDLVSFQCHPPALCEESEPRKIAGLAVELFLEVGVSFPFAIDVHPVLVVSRVRFIILLIVVSVVDGL